LGRHPRLPPTHSHLGSLAPACSPSPQIPAALRGGGSGPGAGAELGTLCWAPGRGSPRQAQARCLAFTQVLPARFPPAPPSEPGSLRPRSPARPPRVPALLPAGGGAVTRGAGPGSRVADAAAAEAAPAFCAGGGSGRVGLGRVGAAAKAGEAGAPRGRPA
jgi:hypothetical protein